MSLLTPSHRFFEGRRRLSRGIGIMARSMTIHCCAIVACGMLVQDAHAGKRIVPPSAPAGAAASAALAFPAEPMIATGDSHVLLVRPDGTLWGWGSNSEGQLGAGNDRELAALGVANASSKYTPFRIGGGYSAVAAGDAHTIALKSDGSLWAWGDNGKGQLGDGTSETRHLPVKIGAGFVKIAAGARQSFAIKADGSLWAWGANDYGQLGDGTRDNRSRPVLIGEGYSGIATAITHTLAVKADGTLWAWGDNAYGQHGDGTIIPRDGPAVRRLPVQVGTNYRAVAAAPLFSAAIKQDGSLWAWGENRHGPVGDGSEEQRTSPVKVGDGFSQVSVRSHVLAIKSDGSLWSWGYTGNGELGEGKGETNRKVPRQIGTGYAAAAAGSYFSVAVKKDGSVWSWGSNYNARLGELSFDDRLTPGRVVMPGAENTVAKP